MKLWRKVLIALVSGAVLVAGASLARGPRKPEGKPEQKEDAKDRDDDEGGEHAGPRLVFQTGLHGFQEVPAVSTTGSGALSLHASEDGTTIGYSLRYSGLTGDVTQAHVHFGRTATNGGIMVFLCSNLGNGPVGTPACPGPHDGEVSGTITAASVVGPSGQGIAAGELAEVLAALRSHSAYGNVHSTLFPAGEIRGRF